MTLVFTSFLRSLDATGRPGAGTDFPTLWRGLRRALRKELRRRGLWDASPCYLGVTGSRSWYGTEPLTDAERFSGTWFPGDALDELATETYLQIFVARLANLRRHLGRKPNIDGIVHRAIRQVIHDAQKRHDPMGYRIFRICRGAVRQLVQQRRLHLVDEAPRITNQSLFSFTLGKVSKEGAEAQCEDLAARFVDELFPRLLVARGEGLRKVTGRLAEGIESLESEGVGGFTFRQLVDPLKAEARLRWAVLVADLPGSVCSSKGEPRCCERLADEGLAARDRFEKLVRCIDGRLDSLGGQTRTREHRRKLWQFLHLFASASDESAAALPSIFRDEELPSNRELSRLLEIPRGKLRGLFSDLEAVAGRCLGSLADHPIGSVSHPVQGVVGAEVEDGARICKTLLGYTQGAWDHPPKTPATVLWHKPSEDAETESTAGGSPVDALSESPLPRPAPKESGGSEISQSRPPTPRRLRVARRRRPSRRAGLWGIAAGLALVVSIGGLGMVAQRVLEGPSLEGAMAHLMLSGDRVTRGGSTWPVLELSPTDRAVVLLVGLPETDGPAHFELRSRTPPSGVGTPSEVLWRGVLDERGQSAEALLLPRKVLVPGILQLELVDSAHQETIRKYTFEVLISDHQSNGLP